MPRDYFRRPVSALLKLIRDAMIINKEIMPGHHLYEVKCSHFWLVSFLRILVLSVAAYGYRKEYMNGYLTFLVAACSLALRTYKSESVLILDGLGVQTSQHGFVRWITDHSTFYAKNIIRACVINEIFEGFNISYVIQIIRENSDELSMLFPTVRPKLALLHEIWQQLQG